MCREYNVLKIYIKLNIYAGLILGIIEIVTYTSLGAMPGMELSLSRIDLVVLLILQTATISMAYPVFIWTKERKIFFGGLSGWALRLEVHSARMHRFMMILLSANILFTFLSGNGVVGRTVTSPFSFLFNIIQPAPIFPIYYICARDTKRPVYWLNILLYSAFRFMCGWSGHIMLIAFLEIFLWVKHNKQNCLIKAMLRFNDFLVVVLFTAGSWLYCLVFPFKFAIRSGMPVSSAAPLNFPRGIAELLSRFTNFPATAAAVQNHTIMAGLYQRQGKPFWEIESIMNSLLPRFIMPDKEYRTLGNIVSWAVYPDLGIGTSTGYNTLVYWANILEADLPCFLAALVVFVILFALTKNIIFAFDNGSRDVEILYFFFLAEIFSGTGISALFGAGYLPLIYSIPIMMASGIIKMKWKPVTITRPQYL